MAEAENFAGESATRKVADFVSNARSLAFPPSVIDATNNLLADYLHAVAVGAATPWAIQATRVIAELGGAPNCTVLFAHPRTDPVRAAFANGVMAHSADIDDTDVKGMLHPGAVVIPAALATAEHFGSAGAEVLRAIFVGYEVVIAVAREAQPEHFKNGFQATGTCGVFGSAAAAANVMGLDTATTASTFGLAASSAGGLAQFYHSGSDVKRMHAGNAASGGVQAALLARSGLEGPSDILEGSAGFFRAFANVTLPRSAFDALGSGAFLDELQLKHHATSARVEGSVNATADVAVGQSLSPEVVEGIIVEVPQVMVGRLTEREPADCSAAQMSLPFSVALTVRLSQERDVRAAGLQVHDYMAHLDDPAVRGLAQRTSCKQTAEADSELSSTGVVPGIVHIRTVRGELHSHRAWPSLLRAGSTGKEARVIRDRASHAVRQHLGGDRTDGAFEVLENLEGLDDVRRLMDCLRPAGP